MRSAKPAGPDLTRSSSPVHGEGWGFGSKEASGISTWVIWFVLCFGWLVGWLAGWLEWFLSTGFSAENLDWRVLVSEVEAGDQLANSTTAQVQTSMTWMVERKRGGRNSCVFWSQKRVLGEFHTKGRRKWLLFISKMTPGVFCWSNQRTSNSADWDGGLDEEGRGTGQVKED